MKDPLVTYLHDHLAGATFATHVLEKLRDRPALQSFSTDLLVQVEQDRNFLQDLTERIGAGSNAVKEAAAWVAEKASRLKLRHQTEDPLGTLEALETLALGILGKLALWDALEIAAVADPRLQGIDFESLAARAEEQHAIVEEYRLRAVEHALRVAPELHEA